MNSVRVDIEGFPKLIEQLKKLSNDKDKKRESLIILRQVAKPTLNAAKILVPVSKKAHTARGEVIQPGNLKESLGYIRSKNENPTVLIGPRVVRMRGFSGRGNGWYGHMVHDGHDVYKTGVKRNRTKSGIILNKKSVSKRTKSNPFMANAYQQTDGQVTADAEKQFTAFIQRRINRLS